ncbi:MAG: CIA30 family protein [Acidimicrobiia bacterium]
MPARLLLVAVVGLTAVACGPSDANITTPMSSSTSMPAAESTTTSMADAPPPAPPSKVMVDFADPASVTGWSNVDDSVMGGVSDSRTFWEAGALVFTGIVSKDNNGGFVSTLSPVDAAFGERARSATALAVGMRLDSGPAGRYLMWLRSADGGRYVAPFTPMSMRGCCFVIIGVAEFVAVDRFLREVRPATPLNPASIVQMGFYLLPDVPRADFRLTLTSIEAVS